MRVIFKILWGSPTHPGSLCHLREIIRRTQVDKAVKVFNTGDEFIVDVFTAHLTAGVCTTLNLQSTSDQIEYQNTEEWLQKTAENIVTNTLIPTSSKDTLYSLHRTVLHLGFLYLDLGNAIRWEDGPQIVRHWKFWLPRFIATGCKNYATESVHLIAKLYAKFPRHVAYIAMHNWTINIDGRPGRGKPIDQLMEHYNL